jgi:uncharacterized membrane protein (DUF4010 family)
VSHAHLLAFVYSLALGLLLGVERERSASDEAAETLGLRTFALISVVGTVAAALGTAVIVVGAAGLSGLLALSYLRTSERDPGTTTEVAALATYLLGSLCYRDAALAAALAIAITVLLAAKARLHAFARERLSQVEVEDALKFLVIAFVVLPLLPSRNLGPYGVVNPWRIWLIVVMVTGISWVGYVAVRALGPRRGLIATGFASGFVSATATTVSMARAARDPETRDAAVAGAQGASVTTFLQLEAIAAVASPHLALWLAAPCALGSAVLLIQVVAPWRRARRRAGTPAVAVAAAPPDPAAGPRRVVTILPALGLAALMTATLVAGRWGAATFGSAGAVAAVALAGLADAHGGSLTAVTLFAHGTLSAPVALVAVAAAMSANAVVKAVVAFGAGGREFGRRVSLAVASSMVAFAGAVALTAALVH